MDTRRVVRTSVALAWLVAACSGTTRYEPGSVPQVLAGEPETVGAVIALARPGAIVLDVSAHTFVAIARFGAIESGELVYPLTGRDWRDYGYPARGAPEAPLVPGRHQLDIPLPWLRVDTPLPTLGAHALASATQDPCRFQKHAWACVSWEDWRWQQQQGWAVFYTMLPAPDSLVEHHLVVLVSKYPWDVPALRARLDDLHEARRVTPAAAAQAAPYYLTSQHTAAWSSVATTVRIQGAR